MITTHIWQGGEEKSTNCGKWLNITNIYIVESSNNSEKLGRGGLENKAKNGLLISQHNCFVNIQLKTTQQGNLPMGNLTDATIMLAFM